MVIKPNFKIELNDSDITANINNNLVQLTLSETADENADEVNLTFLGVYKRPNINDVLKVSLGFNGELFNYGAFITTTSTIDYFSNTTEIRATAVDFNSKLKENRYKLWEDINVKDVISDIAAEHGLNFKCDIESKITSSLQNSSDLTYLRYIAGLFNAKFNIKNRTSLMLNIDSQTLPKFDISLKNCSSLRLDITANTEYSGVKLMWHLEKGATDFVLIGDEKKLYTKDMPIPKQKIDAINEATSIFTKIKNKCKKGSLTTTPCEIRAFGIFL